MTRYFANLKKFVKRKLAEFREAVAPSEPSDEVDLDLEEEQMSETSFRERLKATSSRSAFKKKDPLDL